MSASRTEGRSRFLSAGALLAAWLSALLLTTSAGAEALDLLVVPIDVDRRALGRDDPVGRAAVAGVAAALAQRGHRTLRDDWFKRETRLGKRFVYAARDWIREARRARLPADAMIAVRTEEILVHQRGGTAIRLDIRARLYALPQGRMTYEIEATTPRSETVAHNCARDCLAKAARDAIAAAASEIASAMVGNLPRKRESLSHRRLSDTSKLNRYRLVFLGFNADEMQRVAAFLRTFRGYAAQESQTLSRCRQEIDYTSRQTRSKMISDIRRMLRETAHRNVRLRLDRRRIELRKRDCPSG